MDLALHEREVKGSAVFVVVSVILVTPAILFCLGFSVTSFTNILPTYACPLRASEDTASEAK